MKNISAIILTSMFAALSLSCGNLYNEILDKKRIIIPTLSVSGDAEITSFTFTSEANPGLKADAIGVIEGTTITVTLPEGTEVENLVATFETTGKVVKIGENSQVSGITRNNFRDNLVYTVLKHDTTKKDYTVSAFILGPQWAKTVINGSNHSSLSSVSVASDGSVYAVGSFCGTDTFDFGNDIKVKGTTSGLNAVLIKYNITGTAQWAKTAIAGSGNSSFVGVSPALDGSVYVVGDITGYNTYEFGDGVTTKGAYGGGNIVLVKYNSSGITQWARTVIHGSYFSSYSGVSVATDGSVYATGHIDGTDACDFGNGVMAKGTFNGLNIVLVKYNSSGTAQWAKTVIEGRGSSWFSGVSAKSDGSVYAAGSIFGTDTYEFSNNVSVKGTYRISNIVLVKYNSSGTPQWAKTVTAGSGDSEFSGVSVASDGSVYASGSIYRTDTYNFGNGVTAKGAYGEGNIVLVKYNSSGTAQWAKTVIEGSSNSWLPGVSAASDGSVYASGRIHGIGTYDFGNGVIAKGAYNGNNVILIKYNSTGTAQWAKTVTSGSGSSWFYSVSAASDGSVYASGTISGTGIFDYGNVATVNSAYSSGNIVLVKYKY